MLETILKNEYYSALVILISQMLFIYLRTLNVIHTAERKLVPAMITGNGIGITWLISTAIGANSILNGEIVPIMAFLIGGTLGTYWGIKQESNKHEKKAKDS